MKIGEGIRKLRTYHGMDQKSLAMEIKISTTSISLIETNQTVPRKETLEKIAKVFQVPVVYIHILSLEDTDVKLGKDHIKLLINSLIEKL